MARAKRQPVEVYSWLHDTKKMRKAKSTLPDDPRLSEAEFTKAIELAIAAKNQFPQTGDYQIVLVQGGVIVGVEGPVSGKIVWVN